MASDSPLKFQEIAHLQRLGIPPTSIGYSTVTLQSDKYICVREKLNEKSQLAIIELQNLDNIMKRPITADSSIMNPVSRIVALKANKSLQVFNLELKQKVASHVVDDDVMFWKWINEDVLAFVSVGGLYHWRVNAGSPPERVFMLHATLSGSQIINYHVDSTMKWCVLIGIVSRDSKISGFMQLFSVERNVSQPIVGHAATFANVTIGENEAPSNIFIFASKDENGGKVHMIEVGSPAPNNQPFVKRVSDMYYQADSGSDFPFAVHTDNVSGVIFVVTKGGYVYNYDLESAMCFHAMKVCEDVIFATTSTTNFGFVAINRQGSVFSVKLDSDNFLPYLKSRGAEKIAWGVAERCGFPGAEDAVYAKFNAMLQQGKLEEACRFAARSGPILRTPETIERFQKINVPAGTTSPLLHYFDALLKLGQLNKHESIELCKPVVYQGKKTLVQKWIQEDKLECSEELGDIVKTLDANIALSIYLRCQAHEKVVQCFAETGQFQNILLYVQKVGMKTDSFNIISMVFKADPKAACDLAKLLWKEKIMEVDAQRISDLFFQYNLFQHGVNFLMEVLKEDKPEDEALQTKVLEISIKNAPQVAEAIFVNKMLTHYEKPFVARLCEQAGMMQRAMEHFNDIYDIKRAIVHTHLFNSDWLVLFFGTLSVNDSLECITLLLDSNARNNMSLCVNVALKYYEQLGVSKLIAIFEAARSAEGLFMFLGGIVNFNQDEEVHFKYIQAAAKIGQIKEVERICKESNFYNPEKVKDFLKETKLADHLPMIIVCDRFSMLQELMLYLYKSNGHSYIEMYVQKYNPARLPKVIGSLLDIDIGDDFLQNMIVDVPDKYNMQELVEEVASRNRMKLLKPLLENRMAKGVTDSAFHSALAMVYIDGNANPEKFLKENRYYDSKIVGKFCEKRDSQLAFICYERGDCFEELFELSYKHSLFKNLARFLVERKNESLWLTVLDPANTFRKQLMDQVIQNVLPDCTNPDDVSVTVKCFMKSEMPGQLVELLDKLVIHNAAFSNHRSLQNLLILTAIKADPTRVMDYVTRLDNYDAPDVASIAIANQLFEEAFCIFKKFAANVAALQVLSDQMKNMVRAYEFAERVNEPAVWSQLAKSYVREGMIREALESSMKANDYSDYQNILAKSKNSGEWDLLKKYIFNCRKSFSDSLLDTQYAYCLVQLGEMDLLDKFLVESKQVNLVSLGDLCFDEGQYEAAKIVYTSASQFPKLAITLIKLENFAGAVECSRKANKVKTWRQVFLACVEYHEFKHAQVCALNLIINPEELFELVKTYENGGYFEEMVSLLELSVSLERAHMGLYTELAIAYCKYNPSKLKEHLELFYSRINLPKVMSFAEQFHLWKELVYIYEKYDESDNAIRTMISHPVEAFSSSHFKDLAAKIANVDLLYKVLQFCIEQHPELFNDLANCLNAKLDPLKVIKMMKANEHVPFIKPYLQYIQKNNIPVVNETLNDLYIEEGDYESLSSSVEKFKNFDLLVLAQRLEAHELIEFRRISNSIYKTCNRWAQSIEMAKKDALDIDAITYAKDSRNPENVHNLLVYFCENKMPEAVGTLLYKCYDLVRADDVLEYCHTYGLIDFAIPYFVQLLHDIVPMVGELHHKVERSSEGQPIKEQPSMVMKPQLMIGGTHAGQLNNPAFQQAPVNYRGF